MPGLGSRQCEPNRFQVAHFTEQNDIGVFAQRCFEGIGKTRCIAADLTLRYQRAFRCIYKLHGVFDGQHMLGAATVDMLNHGSQGCTLAGAGRPDDEHKTMIVRRQRSQQGRRLYRFERRHDIGNRAQRQRHAPLLTIGIGSVTT